jgi:hypothetical protein
MLGLRFSSAKRGLSLRRAERGRINSRSRSAGLVGARGFALRCHRILWTGLNA